MAGIKLYDHQLDALKRMKNGCILCGDVGSGKSRTAIAYYYILNGGKLGTENYVQMRDPLPDLYIITTAKKRDTLEWEGELSPFLLSSSKENSLYSNNVIIDSWNNIKKYVDVTNAFFIFDEQRVVGKGAWVKSFLKIVKSNKWIILSATPGDTWMDYVPVFIANGYFRNRTEFTRNHVIYKAFSRYPQVDRYINTGLLIRYRNLTLVQMDSKKKTTLHHDDIFTIYDARTYKDVIKTRWNIYKDKPIENPGELCYILRRIVNSDDSRQLAVLEIVEKHPKVIIFYNFDYELEILKNLAYGPGFEIAEWNGHKHQPIPESEKWIYLVQYTAGAEGWNCIKTDTIIFYSQNYSYKTMKQACGRIDRINTPFTDLYYYHLKSRAWIDIAINRAIENKRNFNYSAFEKKPS